MIDYPLYCQIKDRHDKDGLTITQIARELHLSPRTVGRWLAEDRFRQRLTPPLWAAYTVTPVGPNSAPRWVRFRCRFPVLNPRYKDFADHFGFAIAPCNVAAGNEKGRVENAVGYVKKNFLAGLERTDFAHVSPAARQWLDGVANVRIHGTTRRQPVELLATEKPQLRPLPAQPYDVGVIRPGRANTQFRVTVDANTYSVPAAYAGAALTVKLHPDVLCFYHQDKLIARHVRCYDRHQDFEDPDHPRALLAQRRRARDQKLMLRLLALTPKAEAFYLGLADRRLNAMHHVRKIVALSEIYGGELTRRAIEDALEFQAFSCGYVANLLEQRQRLLPESGALHLTRRQDLLDLELPEPNLGLYASDGQPTPPADNPPAAGEVQPAGPGEPREPE